MGDAAYYIFPDGTTMLLDAGEMTTNDDKRAGTRISAVHPDNSKKAYEWIAYYIRKQSPDGNNAVLDYALVTHFDGDHFGNWYAAAPLSSDGKFTLSGIMGVGALIPIRKLMDRGYPFYNYPRDMYEAAGKAKDSTYKKTLDSYRRFIDYGTAKGMKIEQFKAGSITQISLCRPDRHPDFNVQNIKVNGKNMGR